MFIVSSKALRALSGAFGMTISQIGCLDTADLICKIRPDRPFGQIETRNQSPATAENDQAENPAAKFPCCIRKSFLVLANFLKWTNPRKLIISARSKRRGGGMCV